MSPPKKPHLTSVDLFCGAGGLSFGFKQAGIKSLYAIDSWSAAVETFRENVDSSVTLGEVTGTLSIPKSDVIVGGPPCQGFSSAGLRKQGDQRNTLVKVFAEIVARDLPKMFVFENVEGFLTSESGRFVFDLLDPLLSAGYWIRLKKINAANYGVPQHRKRVLAIGGLGFDPQFPEITHRAYGAPGAELLGAHLPPTPSVLDSIVGLPDPSDSILTALIQGHFHKKLLPQDYKRVSTLQEGQTMRDLPEHLWHDTYRRRANRRVLDGTPTEKRGGAPAGIRRLVGNQPSKTITGGARGEFVHPTQNRYLTLRECARLQTFPDSFIFCGTQSEQSQQIGNAVPQHLGRLLGQHLNQILTQNKKKQLKGKLLEFVPTASDGMSPALKTLFTEVQLKYQIRSHRELIQGSLWG